MHVCLTSSLIHQEWARSKIRKVLKHCYSIDHLAFLIPFMHNAREISLRRQWSC
jgi:hypothetical protein